MPRNVARRTSLLLAALTLSALSHAGDFTFTPGSWSNVTTTGSTSSLLVTTKSDPKAISASLGLNSLSSGTYTVQGTWAFSVIWAATSKDEEPPPNVKVTLYRSGTPNVTGSGTASITSGTGSLLNLDSTSSFLNGVTQYLPDVEVTLPITLQSDGTYKAVGSISSDLISVTFDSQTTSQTTCVESFSLGQLQEAN